ncbi:hypothetical protein [Lentisalinibacter salinarum]|uniref:hypothetical protein n=1 Tax=Lentisalinibacter salinarum TaxID=2992239 RepID=UPI003866E313
MESNDLRCWRCGAPLAKLTLPLSRLDECPACSIPLHVCRMCVHYDPAVARQCREDDAEEVREKERPNFCDYFRPSATAFESGAIDAERRAQRELDSLFGGAPEAGPGEDGGADPLTDAEALFRKE